jgi:hypothetical protein
MRPQWMIIGAFLLCVSASGCRMAAQITRNLVFETCLFTDEVKGKVHYCMLANSAWTSYQGEHPDCAGSADFAKGFKRGYADYLEHGGECCLPRPLPPLRYLKVRYESPEGRAATVAWLDGFRAGATAAKASGYRELIIVPVGKSNHPLGGTPPMPPIAAPADGSSVPGMGVVTPADELPVPRTLPDAPPPTLSKE